LSRVKIVLTALPDLAARGGRKLENIPDTIMDEVLARIAPIFE
jgi:hypothetical protein